MWSRGFDANVGVARNMTAVSATERMASTSKSVYRALVQNITQGMENSKWQSSRNNSAVP